MQAQMKRFPTFAVLLAIPVLITGMAAGQALLNAPSPDGIAPAAIAPAHASQPAPQPMAAEDDSPDIPIVLLSYAEGDVRLSSGAESEPSLDQKEWTLAAPGVLMQAGFTLATGGDGRAEIEFENGSYIYLAPNSVLSFVD